MDNALKIREESAAVPVELETFMAQALQLMQGMADMVRATNERMAALEQQVRMLEKVTPSQASDLNAAIRQRAAAACQEYRMTGMEQQVGTAIRKTVRLATGARSVREIARKKRVKRPDRPYGGKRATRPTEKGGPAQDRGERRIEVTRKKGKTGAALYMNNFFVH